MNAVSAGSGIEQGAGLEDRLAITELTSNLLLRVDARDWTAAERDHGHRRVPRVRCQPGLGA